MKRKVEVFRSSIPLVMLPGNLEVLLNNQILVQSISLQRYEDNAVVLSVQMTEEQKVEAAKLGFHTTTIALEGIEQ